ncbi:hypothetical protein VNO77_11510 [Canavalia gladiata]|uniref:Uncharacterized protein n=1 Tax=Canavalia gladiata TaxID=3824 RepID=A0AAN9MFD5_CANGL
MMCIYNSLFKDFAPSCCGTNSYVDFLYAYGIRDEEQMEFFFISSSVPIEVHTPTKPKNHKQTQHKLVMSGMTCIGRAKSDEKEKGRRNTDLEK